MWSASYEMETNVPAGALYRAIIDINGWTRWDEGLEFTRLDGEARPGTRFVLKPRGGPTIRMSIDEVRPNLLVDTAHLFGAKMTTAHEYLEREGVTTIRFSIRMSGPLAFLWRRVVGEGQIRGAPAQLEAFVAYARKNASPPAG